MKYGYLGPEGTHSEEALFLYLGSKKPVSTVLPYPSIEQVILAVSRGEISHGLVPLENSIEGTVNLTLDLVAGNKDLKLVGEVILPISHNLMVRPGVKREEINLVISHPQALAQCRKFLNANFPGVQVKEVNSTAAAAKMAAENSGTVASIGNKNAAESFGLQIIDCDIQDCRENKTRFVIISKEELPVTGPAKTSLVISISDRPGGLYQILREFALAGINLTKIESRPAKRNLGDYLFFIDLTGNYTDPAVKNCIDIIKNMSASLRVLGCYPVWQETGMTLESKEGTYIGPTLEEVRQDIDILDYQIVELLAKRTQLVTTIGALKAKRETVRDPEREMNVLRQVRKIALRKGVDPELIESIYLILFDHFVRLQEKQQSS